MPSESTTFQFETIGFIKSCFTQKFSIPRQPGLVKRAKATLNLLPKFSHPDIVRGLEQYSHIWVSFVFHQSMRSDWKNTVRPPRLGGNEKLGVFATRSNFRPNPIGQSVVKLEEIEMVNGGITLHLSGVDFLDSTPVLDIKPYIPYADALPLAQAGMAANPPEKVFKVEFSEQAKSQLVLAEEVQGGDFGDLIIEILSFDVRPAYYDENKQKSEFHTRIYEYEIRWKVEANRIIVQYISYK